MTGRAGQSARRPRDLRAWIVSDGKIGMENQCRGIAEALGVTADIRRIDIAAPWRWLPPQCWFRPLAALTGRGDGPPLVRLLPLIGRARAIARLGGDAA